MLSSGASQRIADNLAQVRACIAGAANGREITLVCVTKYASEDEVRALLEAGATDLAENLLPQGAERFSKLKAEGYSFTRHLIGAQQSRKLKAIPGNFDLFQAVDREKTLHMLNEEQAQQRPGERLDVLIQVNIGDEPQKHGFEPDGIDEPVAFAIEQCPALRLRGFMAVPPWPDAYDSHIEFERGTRNYFVKMRGIFDKMRELHPGEPHLDTLSLGMSHDYVWAIEAGATMVRVGGALFEGVSEG